MIVEQFKAYKQGYRAGLAQKNSSENPRRNWFSRLCWDIGWQDGMQKQLTRWLLRRRLNKLMQG